MLCKWAWERGDKFGITSNRILMMAIFPDGLQSVTGTLVESSPLSRLARQSARSVRQSRPLYRDVHQRYAWYPSVSTFLYHEFKFPTYWSCTRIYSGSTRILQYSSCQCTDEYGIMSFNEARGVDAMLNTTQFSRRPQSMEKLSTFLLCYSQLSRRTALDMVENSIRMNKIMLSHTCFEDIRRRHHFTDSTGEIPRGRTKSRPRAQRLSRTQQTRSPFHFGEAENLSIVSSSGVRLCPILYCIVKCDFSKNVNRNVPYVCL